MNTIAIVKQPEVLVFPFDYYTLLSHNEIKTLEKGRKLEFIVDNLSYTPPDNHEKAAKLLERYIGRNEIWDHVNVQGKLTLNMDYFKPTLLEGNVDITKIIGKRGTSPEHYLFSNLRPFNYGVGNERITIRNAAVRDMNLGQNRIPTKVISFYGNVDYGTESASMSVHCLRESRSL